MTNRTNIVSNSSLTRKVPLVSRTPRNDGGLYAGHHPDRRSRTEVIDLPGTYSCISQDRVAVKMCNFRLEGKIDAVLNTTDAVLLLRSRYQTLPLLEMGGYSSSVRTKGSPPIPRLLSRGSRAKARGPSGGTIAVLIHELDWRTTVLFSLRPWGYRYSSLTFRSEV